MAECFANVNCPTELIQKICDIPKEKLNIMKGRGGKLAKDVYPQRLIGSHFAYLEPMLWHDSALIVWHDIVRYRPG
jgi:hypothetical protein